VVVCLRRRSGLEDPAPEDDFDVFVEEKRIGRICFEPSSTLQWHWSLSADLGVGTEGRVDSRSKAVEEISIANRMREFCKSDIPRVPAFRILLDELLPPSG
jgi:hypothetical protein